MGLLVMFIPVLFPGLCDKSAGCDQFRKVRRQRRPSLPCGSRACWMERRCLVKIFPRVTFVTWYTATKLQLRGLLAAVFKAAPGDRPREPRALPTSGVLLEGQCIPTLGWLTFH